MKTLLVVLLLFTPAVAQDNYIVGLKNDMPRRGQVKREFKSIKAYETRLTAPEAEELRKDNRVKYVERDRPMQTDQVQKDAVWNLARIDQRGPLGAPPDTVYTYNATGEGVTIYILDTGVWTEHPEFEGRASVGFGDHADILTCGNGHGTHVAGTAAARTYGVAKRANIVSVRVGDCTGLTVAGLIAGLDWIAGKRIPRHETRVANISITGAGESPALNDAIAAVQERKVFVTVSAGNSSYDACFFFPAGYRPAFTVGASWQADARSLSSNFGVCVDMFAPGFEVVSTWNNPSAPTNTLSGTSMAAPHVAGVAALYLQNHRRAGLPELEAAILSAGTAGALTDIGEGSPNLLVYSLF
jgi:subtilisin family serine protease